MENIQYNIKLTCQNTKAPFRVENKLNDWKSGIVINVIKKTIKFNIIMR